MPQVVEGCTGNKIPLTKSPSRCLKGTWAMFYAMHHFNFNLLNPHQKWWNIRCINALVCTSCSETELGCFITYIYCCYNLCYSQGTEDLKTSASTIHVILRINVRDHHLQYGTCFCLFVGRCSVQIGTKHQGCHWSRKGVSSRWCWQVTCTHHPVCYQPSGFLSSNFLTNLFPFSWSRLLNLSFASVFYNLGN